MAAKVVPNAEFGVGLGGTLRPSEYRELAEEFERFGFSVATVFGDLMMQPPILPLLTMAEVTTSLRLGVGCFTPWTMHPVEMAGQLAYLDVASRGRAFMGIVRGAWMDQLSIDQADAIGAVRDCVAIVRRMLEKDPSGYEGRHYSLAPGMVGHYPVFRPRMPLMVGTWSPRLAAFAGEAGDEVQVGGCANADMVPVVRDMVRVGTEAAARPIDDVRIVLTAVTVVDDDRAAARARARTEVALPFHVIATMDRTVDVDPEVLDRMKPLLRNMQIEEAGRLIPDDVLTKFSFCGTPEDLVEHACRIYEAGAGRIEFDTPFGLTPTDGLRLLGTRVLPALRNELGIGSST